jgi:hypothetical protein
VAAGDGALLGPGDGAFFMPGDGAFLGPGDGAFTRPGDRYIIMRDAGTAVRRLRDLLDAVRRARKTDPFSMTLGPLRCALVLTLYRGRAPSAVD